MAFMFPAEFPHDLSIKPKLRGEKLVYDALRAGLDDTWCVFYDRPVQGTMRRVDFVAIDPARGALAIEVKGGLVHAKDGAFRQVIAASGQRKRDQSVRPGEDGLRARVRRRWRRCADGAGAFRDLVPADGAGCVHLAGVGAHMDARVD